MFETLTDCKRLRGSGRAHMCHIWHGMRWGGPVNQNFVYMMVRKEHMKDTIENNGKATKNLLLLVSLLLSLLHSEKR